MLAFILETKGTYIIRAGDMLQDRSFQQFSSKNGVERENFSVPDCFLLGELLINVKNIAMFVFVQYQKCQYLWNYQTSMSLLSIVS